MRRTTVANVMAGLASCGAGPAASAEDPAPFEGRFLVTGFTFEGGAVLPGMGVAYPTIGDPAGEPVLLIHGTAGTAKGS